MRFENQVAVVTGSSSGIGKAVALKFAQNGAHLVVTSRTNASGGEQVVDDIKALGCRAIYVQADLTKSEQVTKLFEKTLHEFGTVDILINNAGRTVGMPFLESTKKHWLESIETNLISAVLCSIEAVRVMKKKQKGRIVNTSSIRGIEHTGREGIMAYSAAKAALNNFTRTLAKEVAPEILVNAVAPGFVHTGYMDHVSEELKETWLTNIPLKRFITPEEIADAYLYLAGSNVLTGTILVADAGFTLKIA